LLSAHHRVSRLAGLHAPQPRLRRRIDIFEQRGIVRVYSLPIWWHDSQLSVFTRCTHCPWVFMFGEMPLPVGPVPGKSLFSGIFSSEYQ
jgi:hypothetical protein